MAALHPQAFVTDAEVLQELLRRYLAIRAGQPSGREIFLEFVELMRGRIESINASDLVQILGEIPIRIWQFVTCSMPR